MSANKHGNNMIVGVKQTMRMLEQNKLQEVFIAADADLYVTKGIIEVAREASVPVRYIESKKKLGHLCGIDIGAATAGIIKNKIPASDSQPQENDEI